MPKGSAARLPRQLLVSCFLCVLPCAAQGSELGLIRWDMYPHVGQVELTYLGTRLAVYEFRSSRRQPGLRELNTLLGAPVLSDSGEDPPSHRAAGIGLRLQGVDFADGDEAAGWQQGGAEVSRGIARDAAGRLVATLEHRVFYMPTQVTFPREEEAWLIENRRLRFQVDEALGEVALNWSSEFEVVTQAAPLTLEVPQDHGFTVHVSPLVQEIARQQSAANAAADEREAAFPICLTGEADSRPVTVAAFGATERREALVASARLSPTALIKMRPSTNGTPQTLLRGDRFQWRSLVLVRLKALSPESAAIRYREWIEDRAEETR